ncbi:site-specific integrase, partial [Candidatus Woesearchaeota archaeon]|nr:site-specific integrase [Candidatus Woesearchaeota archaeon]
FICFWRFLQLDKKIEFLCSKERKKKRALSIKKEYHRTTEEEIKKVLQHCQNSRDEALVMLFYETGARIRDLSGLKIKNFDFSNEGELRITIPTSKTEKGERIVLAILSVPYVAKWFSQHPNRTDRNDFAFLGLGQSNRGKPLTHSGIQTMLRRTWSRAKVPWSPPHGQRHNRVSIACKHMTDRQLCQYFGWSEKSNMPAVYSNLYGNEADAGVYSMHGIEKDEHIQTTSLVSKLCPRCDTTNETSLEYCKKCGCVLDLKKAIQIQEEKEKLQEQKVINQINKHLAKIITPAILKKKT